MLTSQQPLFLFFRAELVVLHLHKSNINRSRQTSEKGWVLKTEGNIFWFAFCWNNQIWHIYKSHIESGATTPDLDLLESCHRKEMDGASIHPSMMKKSDQVAL